MTVDEIRVRAEAIAAAIRRMPGWRAALVDGASAIGGGSAPGVELATCLVAIERNGLTPDALEARLRRLARPVIARIERATASSSICERCRRSRIPSCSRYSAMRDAST